MTAVFFKRKTRNTSGSGEKRDSEKYGISPSTLSTFLKQKSKIEQNIDADALGPITDFFKK